MIIEKNVKIAKELDDVFVLIEKLAVTIKTKGDYLALMPELINAISGVDQLDDEFKADIEAFINTAILRTNSIIWALVQKPTFEKKEK
jgi:hypothetical protein